MEFSDTKVIKQLLVGFFTVFYVTLAITTLLNNNMFSHIMGAMAVIGLAVMSYISVIFVISQLVQRLDIIDIAWGGGFVVAVVTSFLLGLQSIGWNIQTLVTLLVIVWAARLGFHILRRVSAHPEDARYVELRKQWKGNLALNAYTRIFVLQGVLATIVSIAVIHINLSHESSLDWLAYAGLAIWIIGFLFESIGDVQLKQHLANSKNKGKLMTSGLWQYTRHPNYFGEATMWWGIFVIAFGTQFGWVGVVTPALITYLLLFVSGVPITEKRFEGRKGWKQYKHRTSKFLPLPPRKV